MAELKPCYYCGTKQFLEIAESVVLSEETYQVRCPACGVRGPACYERAEAIDAWNKRS